MTVKVNGEIKIIDENCTITQLIELLNVKVQMMAVAVNMEIVKKEDWRTHTLHQDDRVEMLHFVGGG
jgi:sulfur carrier protein